VHVGATFPLEEAAAAHRALEAGKVVGKAVLIIWSWRPDLALERRRPGGIPGPTCGFGLCRQGLEPRTVA
jgi:hypothetical protein